MLFAAKEKGQGLVEYALILVLIAVVVIVVLTLLGGQIKNVFSSDYLHVDWGWSLIFRNSVYKNKKGSDFRALLILTIAIPFNILHMVLSDLLFIFLSMK